MPEASVGPLLVRRVSTRASCLQNLLRLSQRGFKEAREVRAGRPGGSEGWDTVFPQLMNRKEKEGVRLAEGASANPRDWGPIGYTCGLILNVTLIEIK